MSLNPYAPPAAIPEPNWPWRIRATFHELKQILLLGPLVGAGVGGLLNIVNGYVSPYYFSRVMDWEDHIWLRSILQGMLEGLFYGLGNVLLFMAVATFFSRVRIEMSVVYRVLLIIAALVIVCWTFGGIIFVIDSHLASSGWGHSYAWVMGSIAGAVYGSPLCTLVGIAILVHYQRRRVCQEIIESDRTISSLKNA